MTTRHLLHDAGHYLRAAAPPLLALSVLALARTTQGEAPTPAGVGEFVLVAWRAAVLGTLLWFLVAVVWAATRPLRDRRAFQQLQRLREVATSLDRAFVHVQTIVWSSTAGQDVVVVNVATGALHRVWLQTTTLPAGAFAVMERRGEEVAVLAWMDASSVHAAQRHQRRSVGAESIMQPQIEASVESAVAEDASLLISEAENYLRNHS